MVGYVIELKTLPHAKNPAINANILALGLTPLLLLAVADCRSEGASGCHGGVTTAQLHSRRADGKCVSL